MNMNVVYHSSDLFSPVLATSMISLMENNRAFDSINFYIFENRISDENKLRLTEMVESYGRRIVFIPLPDVNAEQHLGLKMIKENWHFDSYIRMFLDIYLPGELERVLYLDSDTLVVDDLSDLWSLDLKCAPAAISVNCQSKEYYKLFQMSDSSIYCNSGVVLIDLKEWKRRNIDEKVREIVKANHGYVFFMEQSVLSMVLQDEAALLPARYNALSEIMNLTYDEIMTLRRPNWYYAKEEIDAARMHPAIIHMTNSFLITNRCWFENTNHPAKDLYRTYYAMTPWKDQPLFPDRRSARKKLIQAIVDRIPRTILLPMVSLVYNHVRIWKIKADMKKYARQ